MSVELENRAHEILIVDDEQDICELISDVLQDEGYENPYGKHRPGGVGRHF